MRKDIVIVTASHKKFDMPSDDMYLPLQVGAYNKESIGYTRDDTGNNISNKNANYCELTGLYWAWKNIDADYIGLDHYRRHFGYKRGNDLSCVLRYKDIKDDLGKIRVFVPKKRKYYIETLYSHYAHTHYKEHLDITREIIKDNYPDYLNSFDKTMKSTSGYMFNMMIMTKPLIDEYCKWLFDILDKIDKKVNKDNLDSFQSRYLGRISEILFNVWLDYKITNKEINKQEIKEMIYIYRKNRLYKKDYIVYKSQDIWNQIQSKLLSDYYVTTLRKVVA